MSVIEVLWQWTHPKMYHGRQQQDVWGKPTGREVFLVYLPVSLNLLTLQAGERVKEASAVQGDSGQSYRGICRQAEPIWK